MPAEVDKPAKMNLTLIVLDEPTPAFGAVFTTNAFPERRCSWAVSGCASPRWARWW
ncbi:hypothetical protein ACN28S_04820 [Cystobacter fuscus]